MTDEAPASSTRRLLLIAAMCLVLGGLLGLGAASMKSDAEIDAVPARFVPPREEPADFRLRDQEGRPASLETARGQVVVLTFLYTACWDLCPAQASEIADAVGRVGDGVVVYIVSVDPVGDTQEHVREWIDEHGFTHAPFRYLIGSRRRSRPSGGRTGSCRSPTPRRMHSTRRSRRPRARTRTTAARSRGRKLHRGARRKMPPASPTRIPATSATGAGPATRPVTRSSTRPTCC